MQTDDFAIQLTRNCEMFSRMKCSNNKQRKNLQKMGGVSCQKTENVQKDN